MQVSSSWPAVARVHPKGPAGPPPLPSLRADGKGQTFGPQWSTNREGTMQITSDNSASGKTKVRDLVREGLGQGVTSGHFRLA